MRSTTKNLLLWEQRIKERVQKGMTIEKWCDENGVSKYQYYYWNHRIREKQTLAEEMTFADITPTLSSADTSRRNSAPFADFEIFFKSIRITVPSNFDPVALTGLIKVLQEL